MEWRRLRALLLRDRAITARDDVQLQRAVLIEGGHSTDLLQRPFLNPKPDFAFRLHVSLTKLMQINGSC
jgi:hypothetical protein